MHSADGLYALGREEYLHSMIANIKGKPGKIWSFAKTHEDAQRLVRWYGLDDKGVHPFRIGNDDEETLIKFTVLAREEGCAAIACVVGWNRDGSPEWGTLVLD